MQYIADWVDDHTWMVCPYCQGESKLLKREADGRYCPQCGQKVLSLCNGSKK